jgi:toxin ParE1/3/4
VKRYIVGYEPEARADLDDIYGWITREAGVGIADGFTQRLQAYCDGLDTAPYRGPAHNALRPGMRIAVFEKCVSVAYLISEDHVDIVRLLYRGRDLPDAFER